MNSDDTGPQPGDQPRHVLGRRTALRGAAVAASLAWVAPAVQVVSMTTAHAASAPPPDVRPPVERPPVERPPVEQPVERPPVERPPAEGPTSEKPPEVGAVDERPPASRGGVPRGAVRAQSPGVAAAPTQEHLPRTGTSPWGALGVGTASVATGAAALAAAHHLKSRQLHTQPANGHGVTGPAATPVHEPAEGEPDRDPGLR